MPYFTPVQGPLMTTLDVGGSLLGQIEKPSAIQSLLAPVTGLLTSEAQKVADPIVQKIQPMIREELERQVPTFGLYAGLGAGILIFVGVLTGLLTSKERKKAKGVA
jgi:hypothetical protein